jgi:hypothetical protein
MKIALAQYTSAEIRNKSRCLNDFSNEMEEYFKDKNYGKDLKEIVVGIVCVSNYFEQFFKPRIPKYTKEKKSVKSQYTKQEYDIEKCLSYDIKLDFDTFKNSSEIEAKKYLSIILEFKPKIKDFDFINFKKDLQNYFKENEFI